MCKDSLIMRWVGYASAQKVLEGGKRVIGDHGFDACGAKLASYDPDKRVPASMCAIADAVRWVRGRDSHHDDDKSWITDGPNVAENYIRFDEESDWAQTLRLSDAETFRQDG